MKIVVESRINETPRVLQVRGIFDLPAERTSRVEWVTDLPAKLQEKSWNLGLIVGPSGCGKSTLASKLWPDAFQDGQADWPKDASILDGFPESLSIKDVAEVLSSVGFSSPPAWLRPFHVLSNGQKFRVTLARMIAEALCGLSETPKETLLPSSSGELTPKNGLTNKSDA